MKGPIEDLKPRFRDHPSMFVSESAVVRVARFDKALQLLSERGWTESDLQWAYSVLRDGFEETALQGPLMEKDFPYPDEVADDLEDAAEGERHEELSRNVREEPRLAYILRVATGDLDRIEIPDDFEMAE
jgi:hypothetical protein